MSWYHWKVFIQYSVFVKSHLHTAETFYSFSIQISEVVWFQQLLVINFSSGTATHPKLVRYSPGIRSI